MSEEIKPNLSRFSGRADIAVVLGSGLASVEDLVERDHVIPYPDVPGLAHPTVKGHPGRLSLCHVGGAYLLLFAGRLHIYEGLDLETAGYPVYLASELGCRRILLTHAAGGLHREISKMSWLLPSDVVSFPYRIFSDSGLEGSASGGVEPGSLPSRRSPMEGVERDVYSSRGSLISGSFRADIGRAAVEAGVSITDGILFWSSGPGYETCSEARAALETGADAVAMSCLPELAAARRLGMEAACLSWITNHTANVSGDITDHCEVMKAGKAGVEALFRIICGLLSNSGRGRKHFS